MSQPDERRLSFRMPFVTKVICQDHKLDKKYSGTLRDLSIASLFMVAANCPGVGSKCDINIILEGNHSCLEIKNLTGTIVRKDEDGVAIYFAERLEWFALVPLFYNKLRE